ncbi:MAG: radical SAM family heme chaperone HemW [Spirochaetaceae bacterium]|jgi:oxygen-independent coproporphyrinogen-3 oxidase|nr:radical SAM family heme chaperone HemW [Spirochaetaceae bacterium]
MGIVKNLELISGNECSLYIHIPFCLQKCDYCAFYSLSDSAHLYSKYIDVLLFDIKSQIDFFSVSHIPTIYIGGGTPSLLPAHYMERFLSALTDMLPNKPHEWTVEVNPETVTEDFLRVCAEYGVTRISAGIQTMHEPSRKALGRMGETARIRQSLDNIIRYFGQNFSVDIISGLPYSNKRILENDIHYLASLGAVNVSLYDLTIEKDTPLYNKEKKGFPGLPGQDEACELWLFGRDLLIQNGYRQYEVSNFSRDGFCCEHNLRYWRMQNWLGAGPSASGTIIYGNGKLGEGKRYTGLSDAAFYTAVSLTSNPHIPFVHRPLYKHETLSRAVLIEESIFMGFRTTYGPDERLFEQRFGCALAGFIPQTIEVWHDKGLLRPSNPLALTIDGLAFLNRFLNEALLELSDHTPYKRLIVR